MAHTAAFLQSPPATPVELRGPVTPQVLARPGLPMLQGDVIGRYDDQYAWDPYVCIVPAPYVLLAAEDYALVDADDIEAYGESDGFGSGGCYRQYFIHLREMTQRWARDGFGCLYYIG